MAGTRLTTRIVKTAAPPEKGDRAIPDTEVRGLNLRIYSTGRRVFSLRYRPPSGGNQKWLRLGAADQISLSDARQLALRHLGRLAAGDANPTEISPCQGEPGAARRGGRTSAPHVAGGAGTVAGRAPLFAIEAAGRRQG